MNVKVTMLGSLYQSFQIKVGWRTGSTGCWRSWESLEQSTGIWAAADNRVRTDENINTVSRVAGDESEIQISEPTNSQRNSQLRW